MGDECLGKHLTKCPAYVVNHDGQTLCRDDFHAYANLRNDLGGQCVDLNEIEGRCPMEQYGCTFSYTKIEPSHNSNVSLVALDSNDVISMSEGKFSGIVTQDQNFDTEAHNSTWEFTSWVN